MPDFTMIYKSLIAVDVYDAKDQEAADDQARRRIKNGNDPDVVIDVEELVGVDCDGSGWKKGK